MGKSWVSCFFDSRCSEAAGAVVGCSGAAGGEAAGADPATRRRRLEHRRVMERKRRQAVHAARRRLRHARLKHDDAVRTPTR